jgi:hypothetical protein
MYVMDYSGFAPILSNEVPGKTEAVMKASSRERFIDLSLIVDVLAYSKDLQDSYESVLALKEDIAAKNPEIDERLRSPIFKGWLNNFGTVTDWSSRNPSLIRLLNLVSNMQFSLAAKDDWEGRLAVCNGSVVTYDPCAIMHGVSGNSLEIKTSANGVMIRLGTEIRTVSRSSSKAYRTHSSHHIEPMLAVCSPLPFTAMYLRNDISLLHIKLDSDNLYDRQRAIDRKIYDHRVSTYGGFDGDVFLEAADLVRQSWPAEYDDWALTMRAVVPINPPLGWTINGLTDAARQGACWVGARGLVPVVDALVHEQSHVKLRYIEESFPILKQNSKREVFNVGWRSDPRPIEGIVEGVYVNLHVIEALGRMLAGGYLSEPLRDIAAVRLRNLLAQVFEASRILEQNASFTEIGEGFLHWAIEMLKTCRSKFG